MLSFRKKIMSQFRENIRTDGRTDGRTLFYRTLPAEAGGPKTPLIWIFNFVWCCHIALPVLKEIETTVIKEASTLATQLAIQPLKSFLTNPYYATGLFLYLWKHQKTSGSLTFSGVIERDQWHDMNWKTYEYLPYCFRIIQRETFIFHLWYLIFI